MDYKHILLVTDLKQDAVKVAEKTKTLYATLDSPKLSVLHIVKDNMTGFGYEMVVNSPAYNTMDIKRVRDAHEKLAQFIENNQLPTTDIETNVAMSSVEGIIRYTNDHHVDLVIIGHHVHHGLFSWLNRGTADELLPVLGCDLLVVNI